MFKKVLLGTGLAVLGVATLASCNGGSQGGATSNKEKPLVFFNRQPSNPKTGEIDMNTMNFSDKTYYIGFDAVGGGAVQGKMITDYIKTQDSATLDKDNDGVLEYTLLIGDAGHNDSKARTKGIREALKTWKASATDPYSTTDTQEGTVTTKDGTLKVKEIAAQVSIGTDGSTWNDQKAQEITETWINAQQKPEMIVSNNDGMAMGALKATNWNSVAGIPVFGYDANKDALQSIKDGKLTGTVSQNVDVQAMLVLQVIRNILDGANTTDAIKKGITEKDQYGNQITGSVLWKQDVKALLAENSAVTKTNVDPYLSGARDAGVKQTNAPAKKVLLTLYNSSDNFLSSQYKPAIKHYAPLLNLDVTFAEGDGQNEQSCSDKFVALNKYDAYAVNMVKTDSGRFYTEKLN